ncbi:hypothetical protein Agub_g8727, partial [Astrephomene gubernaculifera]
FASMGANYCCQQCTWRILIIITLSFRLCAQSLNDPLVVCGLDHGQRVLQSCHTEDSGIWAGSPRLAVTTMLYKCVAEANSSANMTIRPLRIVVPDGTLVRTFSQLANGSSSSFSRATGVPIEFVIMPPVAYSMARGSMLLDTSPPTADRGYDAIMVAPTAFGDAAQVERAAVGSG